MGLINGKLSNLVNGVSQQSSATRSSTQCELMENGNPSLVEGAKQRSGAIFLAKLIETLADDVKIHIINRDATERYVVVMFNGDIKVFDLEGNLKTVNFPDGKTYLSVTNPGADFKLVTVADHTFIVNTTKTVKMDSSLTVNRGGEVLIWMRDGGGGATWFSVYIDGALTLHYSADRDNAGYMLNDLYNKMTTSPTEGFPAPPAPPPFPSTIWAITRDTDGVTNRLMWLKKKDGTNFTFHATDEDNAWVKYCKYDIQNFEDLPSFALHGYIAHIVGTPSTKFDDYYVQFVADVGDKGRKMSQGYWKETVGQGIEYKFDASTMPHILVREADGTFTFKQAAWKDRVVGDDETNKKPSFVDSKINDVYFYRNRLSFLSDENVIMSEAGEYYNFWRTTVTTIVDSDPIDTAASHNKVSLLRHAVPFQDSLMFFSDQTQFFLSSGDTLSGATAAVKPLTEFESIPSVRPKETGNNVYFAINKGKYNGVMEYYLDASSGVKDAVDITKHVPTYIPATITKIAASTNEGMLVLLTSGETDAMYIYKYYWQGNDKIQSAWCKWKLTGATILNAEFINSDLYLIVIYDSDLQLIMIPCEDNYKDPNSDIELVLDRKISNTKCTSVIYADGVTTFTLPYRITSGLNWKLITRAAATGETQPNAIGISYPFTITGDNTFTVAGDVSTIPFYFGNTFTFHQVFSQQYLRERNQNGSETAVTEGRMQLRKWDLIYGLSGYFRVIVTPKLRDPYTYVFTGDILGNGSIILGTKALNSGIFSFPVLCRNTDVTIEVINDTYWPCRLLSVEWEGYYTARAERRV